MPQAAQQTRVDTSRRLLRWREVLHLTGLRETSARRLIARGDLPAPVAIGPRTVAFDAMAIEAWIAARVPATRGAA